MDDSILPRVAARAMLEMSDDWSICGEASSGEQALEIIQAVRPDLVLMDVHMPGMDGPATTKTLLATYPTTKVLAWTVSDSSDDLLRMMQAGCSGYILKDAGPSELHRALTAAVKSENPVPRKMIPAVLKRIAEQAPVVPEDSARISLSEREGQILRSIARGYPTKRIAADLGLSVPSVETYLKHLFRKLGASNRGEAVSTALKVRLITLADL